jgi:hypothetical protein
MLLRNFNHAFSINSVVKTTSTLAWRSAKTAADTTKLLYLIKPLQWSVTDYVYLH